VPNSPGEGIGEDFDWVRLEQWSPNDVKEENINEDEPDDCSTRGLVLCSRDEAYQNCPDDIYAAIT
jgi:hypothetical protein